MNSLQHAITNILVRNNLKLFGAIYYKYNLEIIKDDNFIACINTDEKHNNYNIKLSEKTVERKPEELLFILLHEMLHGILHHNYTESVIHEIMNIAEDHVINRMLKMDIDSGFLNPFVKTPDDATMIPELMDQDLTSMEVYDWLMKNNVEIINVTDGLINGKYGNGKKILVINDDKIQNVDTKDLEQEMKNILTVAQKLCEERGLMSGSSKILNKIKELTKVKLPWTELLKNCLATMIKKGSDNRSWCNINKRMYGSCNMLLPSFENEPEINKLVLVIDMSGSMSNQLKKAGGVIKNVADNFQNITIIKHDVEIHQILEKENDQFKFDDLAYTVTGMGGTSHKYVFDWLEENQKNIDIVLFFTDYESDVDNIWTDYKWHENVNYKFILSKYTKMNSEIDSPIIINDYVVENN